MAEATSLNNSSNISHNNFGTTSNLVLVNPANQITHVKLGDDNFLLWQLQISSGINGLGLEYLLKEETPTPQKFLITEDVAETINPLYILWCRQDQLLFSFLLGSMAEGIQAQMIGCTTTAQLWSRITHLFATRSKARVMQYKLQLQTLKKGSLSMKDFLSKMKGYVDLLAVCGYSISDDDHVLYILGGVGVEYEAVVVHITSRVDALSTADVSALLMAHEARIESYTTNTDGSTPNINATTFSQSKGRDTPTQSFTPRGRGRGRFFRGGRKNWNNNNRPTCQICGHSGHVAEKCYYRFDKDFVPQHRNSGPPFQPTAHPNRGPPSAAVAMKQPDMLNEDWWFPDSGASHHVTNDLGNLTIGSEFTGEGSNTTEIQALIHRLNSEFSLKHLGDLSYFLGIEVSRPTRDTLFLSQAKYIQDLLSKTKMDKAKSLPTPMISSLKLSTREGDPFEDITLYRSTVGALQYLTFTRPDIAYSVNKVSQFMHHPLHLHWVAVKRILRYLNGTLHYGIHLTANSRLTLTGYSDADWGNDIDDRRSTSGFCWFLGNSPISWHSKKQTVVSRSSTEAEYRSLANATAELLWLKSILSELHIGSTNIPVIWCDNLSTIALSANPVWHSRTKHFELDFFFLREKVISNQMAVRYVPSCDQIADVLTKPLSAVSFTRFRTKLSVLLNPTLTLRGEVK
ncbi:uncharacterized protein [Primulina eburnea]|uniref:uncharacterized protein n=1 Tax=Primulina eburnea TaxID=1245227 RepID=UPI003C6C9BF4